MWRFGPFELDPYLGELRRNGERVPLQDKPLQLLIFLVEQTGRPVGRDEIRQRLWGRDTFIEFDNNLNQAVRKLRNALGDSADQPRFIKTLHRHGYQFVGPVSEVRTNAVELPLPQLSKPESPAEVGRPRLPATVRIVQSASAAALVAVASFILSSLTTPAVEPPAWNIVHLTSFPGGELSPSWSPDGRFAAFSRNEDIFVMPVDGGDPLQLTHSPASNRSPRWSPDGRHLAFLSEESGTQRVNLVPPLGGASRLLVDTNVPYPERFIDAGKTLGSMPWSPDGSELLFSRLQSNGQIAIWKIHLATKRETAMTTPPADSDDQLASWSFDGNWIAFTRRTAGNSDLWLLSTLGGEPEPLLADMHDSNYPAFSPDNRRVIFQSNRSGPQNIWEIEIASRRLRPLTSGPGTHAGPAVSRTGGLLYSNSTYNLSLHRLKIRTREDERLTDALGKNYQPRVSPDANQLLYYSDRRSDYEIWVRDLRLKSERTLASNSATDIAPDWSPDGRKVVFVSNRDGPFRLWVADIQRGTVNRLSEQPVIGPAGIGIGGAQRPGPRWSADGRKIGFLAQKDGRIFLCSVSPNGNNLRWLVPDVLGFDWYLDSHRVIYSRVMPDGFGIREMHLRDLDTGRDTVIYRGPHLNPAAAPDGSGILFTYGRRHSEQNLYLLRLRPPGRASDLPVPTGQPMQLTEGEGKWHVHHSSWFPDTRAIAYDRHEGDSDIYLIDNYR